MRFLRFQQPRRGAIASETADTMPTLTKRIVDASKPRNEGDYFQWDGDLKGFGLRIWPSGRKQFVFQYRHDGATRRIVIGDYGAAWTPDTARKEAGQLAASADISRTRAPERAPHVVRQAKRAIENATVSELAQLFLADRKRKAKPRTRREYQRLISREIVPMIGRRLVNDVTRRDIEALMAAPATKERPAMEDRPIVANNVHSILRAMFTYAIDCDLRANGRNPCAKVTRYPLKSRKQSLTREQYASLGAALMQAERVGLPVPPSLKKLAHGTSKARRAKATGRKRGPYKRATDISRVEQANPVAVAALRFLALSGWREGEAFALRHDAVNRERGVAILQDTKTGRSVRPLGQAALAVIEAQQPLSGNPYVFTGKLSGDHLKESKRLWIAVRHAADVCVRLHDLRHSFTTVGRELGYSDFVIARLVGHVIAGMTGRYGDVPDETVKQAADRIAETIASRLSGKTTSIRPIARLA